MPLVKEILLILLIILMRERERDRQTDIQTVMYSSLPCTITSFNIAYITVVLYWLVYGWNMDGWTDDMTLQVSWHDTCFGHDSRLGDDSRLGHDD